MEAKNKLARYLAQHAPIKVITIEAIGIVEDARRIHNTAPTATAALGRTLMAASMMGGVLKEAGASVTLRIKGDGPLGTVLAVSDNEGNVRGYADYPQTDVERLHPGKLNVGAAVGKYGSLTVIKDLNLKEPYVGTVPLISGEIAEDITGYFAASEQVPTACALGVLVEPDGHVSQAAGYFISLLPGADDAIIDKLEAGIYRVGAVTEAMSRLGSMDAVVRDILSDFTLDLLEEMPVAYRCYCSHERVSQALISLGAEELATMQQEPEAAEVSCQFCDNLYRFDKDALVDLIRQSQS